MENNTPLVSVVVPSYNHEKYVTETIESIINQTYKNIELIVIDDGSKDKSVEVIKNLIPACEKRFTRFEFRCRENKGLSATLNEGIKLSKGKYFCACASDDMYMPDKIEKQVEFMEANPEYGMCHSDVIIKDGIQTIEYKRKTNKELIFEDLLLGNAIFALSVMIRNDVFSVVGMFDESLYVEDWDMWLRISNKGYKIGFIEDHLGVYRRHETNISRNLEKMEEAVEQILDKWKTHPLYKKALQALYVNRFYDYSAFNKKRALIYVFKAKTINKKTIRGLFKLLTPSFIFLLKKTLRKHIVTY